MPLVSFPMQANPMYGSSTDTDVDLQTNSCTFSFINYPSSMLKRHTVWCEQGPYFPEKTVLQALNVSFAGWSSTYANVRDPIYGVPSKSSSRLKAFLIGAIIVAAVAAAVVVGLTNFRRVFQF
jgi:hypothetical protein